MKWSTKSRLGFTLIEVLTVIAIIGILSGVVLVSVSNSQKKGRDGRRVSDINQIRLALSLYYDANNAYPSGNGTTASTLGALASGGFIANLPDDPITSNHYGYVSTSGGYILGANLESVNPVLGQSYSPAAGTSITINGTAQDCNGSNATNGKTYTISGTTYYIYCASN